MTDKSFVTFQIKLDKGLHQRLRQQAYRKQTSIHKLMLSLINTEVADIPEIHIINEGQVVLDGF